MDDFSLKNWIPYKLISKGEQMQCCWLNTFGQPFSKPFFDETILQLKGLSSRHPAVASVSDLSMVEEWAEGLNSIEPTAFIFHISRCGSTLISQLLAASGKHIVLPEVPFFDQLLRLPHQHANFTSKAVSELLRIAVRYYGQKKNECEQHLFIKTDSWHMFFYKQLRELYPNTPFILMYRNPNEVFSSLKKIPGLQSVPGLIEPEVIGFDATEQLPHSLDIYISKVLEKYLQQYLNIIATDDKFLLLNYSEGPIPMIKKIASFVNITLSEQDVTTMTERSYYHSKKPEVVFSEINVATVPSCLDEAMKLYNKLEAQRTMINNLLPMHS
ncbi:sulfotransferase [Mucilaginibacter flavus]|uniref:sulfotransferase n=1 Tax=Mucilaginibacter flavus TaxID=931504 RepID=UPI0025B37162|nr:sulfotransferase [Mucilaginibacter flavus]MDN3583368.1 sulfotransferase [Mucilaginibacter flavus]